MGGKMGKVDVIQEIFDSSGLIRQHYMEVIIPLIVLLLLSAGAGSGSFFPGNSWGKSSQGRSVLPLGESPFAAALSDAGIGSGLALLGGMMLAIFAVILVAVLAFLVLHQTVWLYVCEHFYAIIRKRKITSPWQARCTRLATKAAFMQVFWLAVAVALFSVPALFAWDAVSKLQSPTATSVISSLGPALLALLAAVAALLILCLLLSPLWVFYAMDGLGFFDSIGRSFSLVAGSFPTFVALGVLFGLLGIGTIAASAASCCFSQIVSPILAVFFSVLWGVTLMKVKLKLEKQG